MQAANQGSLTLVDKEFGVIRVIGIEDPNVPKPTANVFDVVGSLDRMSE
jgi:hypothetical protein